MSLTVDPYRIKTWLYLDLGDLQEPKAREQIVKASTGRIHRDTVSPSFLRGSLQTMILFKHLSRLNGTSSNQRP